MKRFVVFFGRLSSAALIMLMLFMNMPLVMAQETSQGTPGISQQEFDSIYGDYPLYEDNPVCEGSGTQAPTPGPAAGTSTYILGDSISYGLFLDGIESKLGGDAKVNYDGGRSITGPGTQVGTSALDAADADKDIISGAGKVVIVLGTNQTEADFGQSMKDLLGKLKGFAPNATYYWVDIGATAAEQISGWSARNKIIYEQAASEGYTVISRYKAIFGQDKDPLNLEPLTMPGSSDNIHGSYPPLTQAIVDTMNGTSTVNPLTVNVGANCSCQVAGGSTTLTGSDNAEKIYNFLTSGDRGLSPVQAAGIMGNLFRESGYDPAITEHGSGIGYGIAQWSFGRRTALEAAAAEQGVEVSDLSFQLNFLFNESKSRQSITYPDSENEWEGLKRETELVNAVLYWEKNFERSAETNSDPNTNPGLKIRIEAGTDALNKFGSNSGTGGTSDSSKCGTSGGFLSGGFSLPLDKKWYDEHKDWFTKPHHDYPAADIPVPTGTPVYSMTAGTVIKAPNEGGYGTGVTIDAGDGITFIYGHGSDGGSIPGAKQGDVVKAGQLIMHSASTGQSTGPHLHLEIDIGGGKYCPQTLFVGIVESAIPAVKSLPTSGCTN